MTPLAEFTPPGANVGALAQKLLTAGISYQEALFCYVPVLHIPVDFPFIVSISSRSSSVNVRSARLKDEKFCCYVLRATSQGCSRCIPRVMAHPKRRRVLRSRKSIIFKRGA
jgi:hypothetical protein